ncbi:DUF1878 domain-containing protein [Bacillus haynesii]|uniref:DUF1878 domain-containing protein n=1 Tax=Bacillus haynesii TaxID=1925021 RepID=UPI0022801DB4|nr:DUF1878 domain-containing protein [Bacillus haynesii]MCY7817290.1 DUF1878 domain-containing protein [Bacillus haynesii]MCY8569359.1 DUF1878 domain-containing protein [Bacillus haynesii]MCY8664245.1 DUF1878 domain-containing protein [Bacillus haynesii]
MDNEKLIKRIEELEKTVELLTFKQSLLFSNTSVDRALYEYDISKNQYNEIMDLMDNYRSKIDNNEKVNHHIFENEMYEIVPQHSGNYHFVESLTRAFWENNRWEEVFDNLYRILPKYKHIKKGF